MSPLKLTGKCCRNSSNISMSSSVLSAGSFSRHSRTVSRTISDYNEKNNKAKLDILYVNIFDFSALYM